MRKFLLPLLLASWSALAQVSTSPPLLNYKGTTLPTNCTIGRLFFDTNATAGQNVYGCTAANTWTLQGSGGSGTVTSFSCVTANGVSCSVANATTTPAATFTLGAITPTTVNGNTITTGTGTLTLGAGKTATISNTLTFTGTDASSVAFGGGGTVLYSGGPLGTPSSGTLTNATGLPPAGVVGTAAILGANTFTATQTITPPVGSKALVITGATQTADFPIFDLAQTWNNAAINFTATKLNVTNTASGTPSYLMDLQVGAITRFNVGKFGGIGIGATATTNSEPFYALANATQNADFTARIVQPNNATNSYAALDLSNDTGTFKIYKFASTFTPNGLIAASTAAIHNGTGSTLISTNATSPIILATGGTAAANEVARFLNSGTSLALTQGTANQSVLTSTGYSLTGSSVTPAIDIAGTLNTTGASFNIIKFAITHTASGAGVNFLNFLAGASGTTSMFSVSLAGAVVAASNITATSGYLQGTELYVTNSGKIHLGTGSGDVHLVRSAAAILQQGEANAASPVAQILQAQGSRSGTDSNVGGAAYTVSSGLGTGTGTLSTLNLSSPIQVASGTGAQTQTVGWRINNGTGVSTGYTVAGLAAIVGTPLTGARVHVTDQLTTCAVTGAALTGGGAKICPAFYDGTAWVGG